MSQPDLVPPLDASATRMQVVTRLTTAWRTSALVEACHSWSAKAPSTAS